VGRSCKCDSLYAANQGTVVSKEQVLREHLKDFGSDFQMPRLNEVTIVLVVDGDTSTSLRQCSKQHGSSRLTESVRGCSLIYLI